MGKKSITALVVVLLACGGAAAYWHFAHRQPGAAAAVAPAAAPALAVEAVKAIEGTPTHTLRTAGEIAAAESIMLRNNVAGVVAALHFENGATVEKGTLLVSIDDGRYRSLVAEREAAHHLAQQDFTRRKTLYEKRLERKSDYDQALATLGETAAQLEQARIDLRQTELRAPFDGTLGIARVSEGAYLEIGSDIVNLESSGPMVVYFRLAQRFIGDVAPGDRFTITSNAQPGRTFEGTIQAIDPEIDPNSRTLRIQGITPNSGNLLRPGQFVVVQLDLVLGAKQVFVPAAAIVFNNDKRFVVKVVDGKTKPTEVATGIRFAGQVAVTGEIAAGDTVIVAGQQKAFREGVPVTVSPPRFPVKNPTDEVIVRAQQ